MIKHLLKSEEESLLKLILCLHISLDCAEFFKKSVKMECFIIPSVSPQCFGLLLKKRIGKT